MARIPFFSPEGRIGRREYWLTYGGLAAGVFFTRDASSGWLFWTACAIAAWVGFVAAVKRLHDCDYSAYWLLLHLLWVLPAIVCPVGLLLAGYRREGVLLFLGASAFWALWWVWFSGFSRSTPGTNEYGPPNSGSLLWKPPPPRARRKNAGSAPTRAGTGKPRRLAGEYAKQPMKM